MFIQQYNCETGEMTERKLTAKEIKDRQDQHNAEVAADEAKAAQRQALLIRLGITEEEARILLGGN